MHKQIYSFTRKFKIKTTKRNGICLEYTKWKSNIHIESIFTDSSELHIDLIIIVLINQLEVLNWSLVHTTVEIQHERLNLLIPLRWFVEIKHYIFCFILSKFALNSILFNFRVWPIELLSITWNHRKQHFHSSWSFWPQHIGFVLHNSQLLPRFLFASAALLRILLTIINRKLSAKHIWPDFSKVAIGVLLELLLIYSYHIVTRRIHSFLLTCQHISISIR